MPCFLIVLLYCLFTSLYIMQKKYRFSTYIWMTALQKLKQKIFRTSKCNKQQNDLVNEDNELGLGSSIDNIVSQKEIEIQNEKTNSMYDSRVISPIPSMNNLNDEYSENTQSIFKQNNIETFLLHFKNQLFGINYCSLYSMRSINNQSSASLLFGIVIYLITSLFISYSIRISITNNTMFVYCLQIFFFEILFALSFSNFVSIATFQKEYTFLSYLTRLVSLNLLHISIIVIQFWKLELVVFAYYVCIILFYCPSSMKPLFETENLQQNTLEMYHLTFLGKISGRFMFFYVRRIDEINFRLVLAAAVNKQLQIIKEQKYDNKNVHKVHYNKQKKILTLWTKLSDSGIDIVLYHVPSLKCLQITNIYKSPAANVYGYQNNEQKYCLINKIGHNVHLFEGNVYITAIPIPGRPAIYDDFFIYELDDCDEIVLGKTKGEDDATEYRVYRVIKRNKTWIAEDSVKFDEIITHQILINNEKILFISATWNIYIYDSRTLKQIKIISNLILPNSLYCQLKYHHDQELFELGIQKEFCNFLIPDLSKPKILAKIDQKEFNSLVFLNHKPIILCFQKSGKFFKRTVNYSLYNLPKKEEIVCELTASQTDLEKFYTEVPEI